MNDRIVLSFFTVAFAAAVLFPGMSCAGLSPEVEALDRLREALAEEAGPLERASFPQTGPFVSEYWENADRLTPGYRFSGTRLLGTFTAAGWRLGVVLLTPADSAVRRGVVIALHGYAAYSALNLPALYLLAEDGWTVFAVDLPGHGFSSGRSADIGDFGEYGACVRGVVDWIRDRRMLDKPRPLVLLGHSTGGAAVLEALRQNPAGVDRAVLIAPLLEPRSFAFTSAVASCAGLFSAGGPFPGDRTGYLSPYIMPFSWVRALGRFRDTLHDMPRLSLPVLVVQGDEDRTLDWQAGLRHMKRIAPGAVVCILHGRGHTLFDRGPAQAETIAAITLFLDEMGG